MKIVHNSRTQCSSFKGSGSFEFSHNSKGKDLGVQYQAYLGRLHMRFYLAKSGGVHVPHAPPLPPSLGVLREKDDNKL